MTLEQANQLVDEARFLWRLLNEMFMAMALPMARNGEAIGNSDTDRLCRLSDKAYKRLQRRKDMRDDLKWPLRAVQRKRMEEEEKRKMARKRK